MLILPPISALQISANATVNAPADMHSIGGFVTEAAQRFALPEGWIYAVMSRESMRNPVAVSPKGAQGLMQLMPATWQILRIQLSLGDDPFDPHDNIIAGAAYLRALYDRYGVNGFLAAYNAGPGRYEDWLKTGRALPMETRRYVAQLMQSPALVDATSVHLAPSPIPASWAQSALFTSAQVQPIATSTATGFRGAATPFAAISVAPATDAGTPSPPAQ